MNADATAPAALDAIRRDSIAAGFSTASEDRIGSLLHTLVISKLDGACGLLIAARRR